MSDTSNKYLNAKNGVDEYHQSADSHVCDLFFVCYVKGIKSTDMICTNKNHNCKIYSQSKHFWRGFRAAITWPTYFVGQELEIYDP